VADGGSRYLPISDGMAKDIDSGKAATRDLADFLPDNVAQELHDSSNPGPVHAENLIPISPQQGAAMRAIDPESGSLPKFPATRRVLPAKFKRDAVTGGSHGKAWTLVAAGHQQQGIREGDIITEVGLVTEVLRRVRYGSVAEFTDGQPAGSFNAEDQVAEGTDVVVTGMGGKILVYDAGAEVKVFRSRTSGHGEEAG
jgi:hypothetical protein